MRVAMAESTLHAQRQLVQARKLVFPAFLRLSMVDEVRRRLLSLYGVTLRNSTMGHSWSERSHLSHAFLVLLLKKKKMQFQA